jgi:glutathione S-transferase
MIRYYPQRHTENEKNIPSILAAQDKIIAEALAIIDKRLSESEYVVGDSITACDYFLFMLAERSLPIESSPMTFPHLSVYLKNLIKNETIQSVCEFEGISLAPFK